jgi:TQXA domain-containing protein
VGAAALVQPAHADPVTGELQRDGGSLYEQNTEHRVVLKGHANPADTGLFRFKVDNGPVLYTYCIDFGTNAQAGVKYGEADWNVALGGEKGAKITWILNNSVPALKLRKFNEITQAKGIGTFALKEAVAGTQAAIWHFSDGLDLDETRSDEKTAKLYRYLTESAEGTTAEPQPALELTPDQLSGKAGEKIGPFGVATTADEVSVLLSGAPEGVTLVDEAGAEATKAKNGDKLYVKVPKATAEGSAKIEAEASAVVGIGRVFKGRGDKPTQTMIVGGTNKVEVKADATASWSKEVIPPAPGAKVTEECAEGGVGVKLTNTAKEGGEAAEFTVESKDYREEFTVEAGDSKKIVVPVAEDSGYVIKVTSKGFSEELKGNRDCVKPSPTPTPTTSSPAPGQPAPAPGGLAETGANNLGLQLGIGALLLALGGGVLFYLRRRSGQASTDQ